MWAEHFAMWRQCLGGTEKGTGRVIARDVAMAGAQAGLLMKLRADYDKALQKHTQWEIDQRRLIPANEFHAFRSGFLIPLRNMLSNMPAEQAALVNPANQQQAIRGGTEYLINRLMPQIQQCIDSLDHLTPVTFSSSPQTTACYHPTNEKQGEDGGSQSITGLEAYIQSCIQDYLATSAEIARKQEMGNISVRNQSPSDPPEEKKNWTIPYEGKPTLVDRIALRPRVTADKIARQEQGRPRQS